MRAPRLTVAAGMVLAVSLSGPLPARAHGLGGTPDLPAPLIFFVVAALIVLAAVFTVLGARWTTPRLFSDTAEGHRLPALWGTLGVVGTLLLVLTLVAGAIGIDNPTRNPASVVVMVGLWLILPFVAAVLVDLYPAVSPWRRLPAWLSLDRPEQPERRDRVGYWPATLVFVSFAWFVLVAPDSGPRAIALAALVFTVYMLAMSRWMGTEGASRSADGFAVYARFLGAMAPFSFENGMWRRRGWLRGLPALEERPGIAAFVIAMIGTVLYDGLSSTEWWLVSLRDPLVSGVQGLGASLPTAEVLVGTLGVVGTLLLVGAAYLVACWVSARLAGTVGARDVARRLAHTLVPVGFAYAFAHYFTSILVDGQLFASTFSDPFGLGWDLFGSADRRVDASLLENSPAWVWFVQVGVVVGGHVAAVVLARDRLLSWLPSERALAAHYPLLVLVQLLAVVGLVVLGAG